MTKAVGDFLGTNGIADEMIRFNGFPFLEKEDQAYNVTGKLSRSRKSPSIDLISRSLQSYEEESPYDN